MIVPIAASAAGVLVLLAALYGALRKFSRVTWIGIQLPVAFFLTLLLDLLPETGNEIADFSLQAGGLTLIVAAVLAAGGIGRNIIFSPRRRPAGKALRILNRVFGGVAAVLALLCTVAVPGLFALAALETFGVFSVEIPVVETLIGYAGDLFLVAALLLFMRAGFRLGLLRAIFYLLMFAMTFASFVGAVFFTWQVGFMQSFTGWLAGLFGFLHRAVASVLGFGIAALLVFAVFFAVTMLFGALLNFLIKKINSVRVIGFIDGTIVCILYTAVLLALVLGTYFGTALLADGVLYDALAGIDGLESLADGVTELFGTLGELFRSSPLCAKLYDTNPLIALFG